MIELTAVLLIIFIFLFPIPALTLSMGLLTTWILYGKYAFYSNLPPKGKRIHILTLGLFSLNIISSIFLGIALALAVHYLIYENLYLLIFNFLFCFAISLRWFDFTHNLYRQFIYKLKPIKTEGLPQPHFVVCQGFREKDGFGLAPVYIDAGILELENNKVIFSGALGEQIFSPSNIIQIEKKSSEKIKIFIHANKYQQPHIFLITLTEQFYPFKSRVTRDKIFKSLSFAPAVST